LNQRIPFVLALAIAIVISALLAASFGYGFAVNRYRLFPYRLIVEIENALEWSVNQATGTAAWYYPDTERTERITIHGELTDPDALNLVTSLAADNRLAQQVIDMEGNVVHEWQVDWFDIWSDATHLPADVIPKSRPGTHIHGTVLLPDGDLIYNYEKLGSVRMNICGEVVWKLPYRTHHSVFVDEKGDLWFSASKMSDGRLPNFPKHEAPVREPFVLQVSPDGEVLREISVMELLDQNGLRALLHMRAGDISNVTAGDALHLNDVDVFPESLEEGLFKHGDVMISLRNINTVLSFDPESLRINFLKIGGFVRQHDPDFVDGNTITLFDNNYVGPSSYGQQSRIIMLNAGDGESELYFSGSDSIPFYTKLMGKHQALPNGNMLITESDNGRAFEIDESGEIVWEFVNLVGDGKVGIVQEVQRLSTEAATLFENVNCK